MKKRNEFVLCAGVLLAGVLLFSPVASQEMAFGGKEETAFAADLWNAISNYPDWPFKTELMQARSPHGKFVRSYYNLVRVGDNRYHVIVKDGYGDGDISREDVIKSSGGNIVSVAVMVQREEGYDPNAQNWYWVRYNDRKGTVTKTPDGTSIAGKIPKCISCHERAGGNDLFFTNDGK